VLGQAPAVSRFGNDYLSTNALLEFRKANLQLLTNLRPKLGYSITKFVQQFAIWIDDHYPIALKPTQEHFRLVTITWSCKKRTLERRWLNYCHH
jgi:hypothetical protein